MATNPDLETAEEERARHKLRIEQLKVNIRGTGLKLDSMKSELKYHEKRLERMGDFP